MQLLVEVSAGELIDKITILEIKEQRITNAAKLANIRSELRALTGALANNLQNSAELDRLRQELSAINLTLWQIEEDLRECEVKKNFGSKFVELARAVYINNDKRAALKRRINLSVGSRLVEEKSYLGGA